MKEFKRYFAPIIIVSICAVLLIGGWLFTRKTSINTLVPDHFVQDKEALLRLLENSAEIHRLWNEGEDSREWTMEKSECLKHFEISSKFDESLMRCNPMLLVCNNLFNKKIDYHFVKMNVNNVEKYYRYITKSNSSHVGITQSGFLFTIEDNKTNKKLNLLLEDQCHEVFLQNRIFAYGEEITGKNSDDYRFDNFSQNIYIDQHLVTNAEVNEWINFGNQDFTKGLLVKNGDELLMPATNLTYAQMENYCSFKGKQLLLAHYFDAATFLPMDLSDILPKKNNRSPYYWTKKRSEFKADCNLFYAEECSLKRPYYLNSTDPSWSGLKDSMGGVFEAFRNPIDSESNLKASSFYFKFNSPWHRLGFRAAWDGEGFDLRNFDFKGINPEGSVDKFKVGFRCMRESK